MKLDGEAAIVAGGAGRCMRPGNTTSDGRLVLPAMRQQFLKAAGGLRR